MCVYSDDQEDKAPSKQKQRAAGAKVAALKAQLKAMLAQPLVARGVSTRYITSGVRSIADDLIAGECASPFRSCFVYSPLYRTHVGNFRILVLAPFHISTLLLLCTPATLLSPLALGRSTFRVVV